MAIMMCQCTLSPSPAGPPKGTLRVRVVDDSRADACANVISEVVDADLQCAPGSPMICAVDIPAQGPPRGYAVQAHFDLDGSGEVEVGDYVTMQRYGVTEGVLDGPPLLIELGLVS